MARDVTEDQLAFTSRVAGVDQPCHIFALDQFCQQFETVFRALERLQIKMRRQDRQMRERPLAAFDLDAFGRNDGQQVADCGAQNKIVALEVIALALEAAQHARNISRHRGFLGDDQFFSGRRDFFCGGRFLFRDDSFLFRDGFRWHVGIP